MKQYQELPSFAKKAPIADEILQQRLRLAEGGASLCSNHLANLRISSKGNPANYHALRESAYKEMQAKYEALDA